MNRIAVVAGVFVVAIAAVIGFLVLRDGGEATTTPSSTVTTTAGTASSTVAPTTTAPPSTTQVSAGYEPSYEEARCQFDVGIGVDVVCGFMTVPEDRTQPDNGREVRLHVAIFRTDEPNRAPDPILYLDGGPGGETLEPLDFTYSQFWEPFVGTRDLIMFDQRGVGYSTPSLECNETRELTFELLDDNLPTAEAVAAEIDALTRCRDRLVAAGIDLAAYNSAANAADVEDLRKVLGYSEWNLLGISYGTRLAQTVMRDHPDGVRSVILDSVYTPDVDLISSAPENLDRAFRVLFDGCEADPACSSAYPNLEQRLYALADRLDAAPVTFSVRDVFSQERYEAVANGDELLGTVFQGLYSAEVIPILPQLIAEMEVGETGTMALLRTNNLANGAFFSYGMHLSVQCNEELPFTTPEEVEAGGDAFPELAEFFDGATNIGPPMFEICALWDAGTAAALENEPVSSPIPTLVYAGDYDPITPPAWGQLATQSLSNAMYVQFPGVGHGASLSGDCPLEIALAFLDDPQSRADVGCVVDMGPPEFDFPGKPPPPIELIDFDVEIFGFQFSGLRPDGWEEISPGAWTRGATGIDQTAIIQQVLPSIGDPGFVVSLFEQQLGFDEPASAAGTYESPTQAWQLFTATLDGFPIDIAVTEYDTTVGAVLLVTNPDERDVLIDTLLEPVLDGFEPA